MTNAKPIRENNAIDQIAFIVVFKKPISDRELLELLELKEGLSQELPEFEKIDVVQMTMDSNNPRLPVSKLGGMNYAKKSSIDASRFEWSLRIENNSIVVACSEYSNWNDVWDKAKMYLKLVLEKCDVSGNPVIETAFQCIDKFVGINQSHRYEISNIFDINSDFLTKHVVSRSSSAWHLNQGWFKTLLEGQIQSLNNLNLNAQIIENKPYEIIISHVIKMQKTGASEIDDTSQLIGDGSEPGYLEEAMNTAHTLNKSVVLNLLAEDMAKTIGLKE